MALLLKDPKAHSKRQREKVSERLLIREGRLIDPRNGKDEEMDLLIEDGVVREVGHRLPADSETAVLDAKRLCVMPGLIDVHVHLREPGGEHKETIETGTAAAAQGGFTSVLCMPNTSPPLDNVPQIQLVRMKAQSEGWCRVYPIGAITRGQQGTELTEFGTMRRAGCVALSDDGSPVANSGVFRRALEYAKTFHLVLIDHCEEPDLAHGGVMNEGKLATRLGLKGIPRQAEYIMVARDIALSELTGGRVHLAHVSTRESVSLVREAKKRGVAVTAEVCPHHFTLTEEAVGRYNTLAKMNPPLREQPDLEALWAGLADGTLDVIASDHAPHTQGEKAREFDFAPFGVIGLETTLPLVITQLVRRKILSLSDAVARLTDIPARLFGLPGGHLGIGAPGDVTLVDLEAKKTVKTFTSKSSNSPFVGSSG